MKTKNLSFKILLPLGLTTYFVSVFIGIDSYIGSGISTLATIITLFGWFDLFGKSKYMSLLPYILLLVVLLILTTIFETGFLTYINGSLLFALVFWFISLPIKIIIQKRKNSVKIN